MTLNYTRRYAQFLKRFLRVEHPVSVVFDCSNGTVGLVLRELLRGERRIRGRMVNGTPDGAFPAHGPNPMSGGAIEELGRRVSRAKADLGAVFDADGDRVFFVDDRGRPFRPDHAAIAIASNFKGPVIVDVRSGYALREWLRGERRRVIESRVGHFFIKKLMRKKRVSFAAESSGHYYFKDFFFADSGLLAAIHVVNRVARLAGEGKRLSAWVEALPEVFSAGELNFEIRDKEGTMRKIEAHFRARARKISKLDGIRMEFPDFWFSVRPSNTEDLLRLNLEAKDKNVFTAQLKEVRAMIQSPPSP